MQTVPRRTHRKEVFPVAVVMRIKPALLHLNDLGHPAIPSGSGQHYLKRDWRVLRKIVRNHKRNWYGDQAQASVL